MTAGFDLVWNSSFSDTLQLYILLVQPWFISKIDVPSSEETVTTATVAYFCGVALVPHKL